MRPNRSVVFLLLYGVPGAVLAQQPRVIHTVNTATAPLQYIGSLATQRLVPGAADGTNRGTLLFSAAATEPKLKFVGSFATDTKDRMEIGKLSFKNGDLFDGDFSYGVGYGLGEYRSKPGGWLYKGGFNAPGESAYRTGIKITFANGDRYQGSLARTSYQYKGTYRFADGETIVAAWATNQPTSGSIILAGQRDTLKGTFALSGPTSTFTSQDGRVTRQYRTEENLDMTPATLPAAVAAGATPTTTAAAPAATDFCGGLQQAMLAAANGAQGLKALAADLATTGTYTHATDGTVLNASAQLPGARQTAIYNFGGTYSLYAVVEDVAYEYALPDKYEEWKKKVTNCLTALGRPATAFRNGEANMYYESGAAVVAVRYSKRWAGTTRAIVYIEVSNTAAESHTYRTATEAPTAGGGGGRRASVYTTYLFVADCSNGRQQNFKTVCGIDADLSKHKWEEVQAEASRLLNGSGRMCGSIKYLGKKADVAITGTPGRDYAVTGGTLMDF